MKDAHQPEGRMGIPYRYIVRPSLRFLDSEKAHKLTVNALSKFAENRGSQKLLSSIYRTPNLPINVFGKLFRHPLGLAAGFDKSAQALGAWPSLGFSWAEYGGITRYPQEGNPKPRMFRSNSDAALINRMGFNNPGAQSVRDTLAQREISGKWPNVPLAANIGRSKTVSNERAPHDYADTFNLLYDYADIFVLNVSSPNTPGLRELQEEDHIREVVNACTSIRDKRAGLKPILLKFSPDLDRDSILSCAGAALSSGIDGFVATNTTISRPAPKNTGSRNFLSESGGLSGRPLHEKSIQCIGDLFDSIGNKVPIIGCGGIESPDTAWNAISNGATLIQLYSALVFQGPSVVSQITHGLNKRLKVEGFSDIQEVVGYSRT